MSAAAVVPLAEYLATCYHPDREYVDGAILERNLGEFDHSQLTLLIAMALAAREQELDAYALPEQRVQVRTTRFRIPDLCLIRRQDREQIIRKAPLLCVEILSPEDTVKATENRINDFLTMGVPTVWLVDPQLRRGSIYTPDGMKPAQNGLLEAETIRLTPLFAQR